MNDLSPVRLWAVCTGLAALAVPLAFSVWLRANDSFIGGLTMIGSSNDRPKEIAPAWLFVITGLLAAVAYAVPAGLVLILARRLNNRVRGILVLIILPVAVGFVWNRLTGRG
jgi:hypothetical protein